MPGYEDDIPRLAEIARTLSDFRAEFREAVNAMVRRDVYAADMRTLEQRISVTEEKLKESQADKRNLRNLFLGAVFTTGASLVVLLVTVLVK